MPLQEVCAGNARALQDIADAITRSHRVLVVTGAGISTSCGIPDFRSKDGLYNLIPQESMLPTPPSSQPCTPSRKRKASALYEDDDQELPSSQSSTSSRLSRVSSNSPASRMRGQDLFHARVFQNSDTTEVFYRFITSLRQKIIDDVKDSSLTHKFIRTLRDGGRLMRCYTQNIDGLEAREGLCLDLTRGKGNKRRFMRKHVHSPRPENSQGTDFDGGCEVVQLHGELTRLRCTMCSTEELWTDDKTEILLGGNAPKCETCNFKSQIRQATGKRGLTVGGLRPNIVLYGEEHPHNTLLSPFVPYDIASNPDTLLIMGTSLKVHGLQKIIRDFAKAVHNQKNGRVIFVNRTRPAESVWDGVIDDFVEMDCDEWVNDLRMRREDLWFRQGELDLKIVKMSATKQKRKSAGNEGDGAEEGAAKPAVKKLKVNHKNTIRINVPVVQMNDRSSQKTRTSTSEVSRSTKWKGPHLDTPTRRLLSPMKRAGRPAGSPITPSFSPLTPRSSTADNARQRMSGTVATPSKLRVIASIAGSACDDENDVESALENAGSGSVDDEKVPAVHDHHTHSSQVKTDGRSKVSGAGKHHLLHNHADDIADLGAELPAPAAPNVASTAAILNRRSFIGRILPDWLCET